MRGKRKPQHQPNWKQSRQKSSLKHRSWHNKDNPKFQPKEKTPGCKNPIHTQLTLSNPPLRNRNDPAAADRVHNVRQVYTFLRWFLVEVVLTKTWNSTKSFYCKIWHNSYEILHTVCTPKSKLTNHENVDQEPMPVRGLWYLLKMHICSHNLKQYTFTY